MRRRQLLAVLLAAVFALGPAAGLASSSGEQKKKGGGLSYIQMRTLTATVIRADGRRGVLTLDTGIDVPDSSLRAYADLAQPRLRAAYVQVLQTYAAGLPSQTAPDADFLSRELQRETDRVLGRKGARLLLGTMLLN